MNAKLVLPFLPRLRGGGQLPLRRGLRRRCTRHAELGLKTNPHPRVWTNVLPYTAACDFKQLLILLSLNFSHPQNGDNYT